MINLTTNTKSFSVEKGTAGNGKTGLGSSTTKIIKQIINNGGGSGGGSSSVDVFTGATADNPGRLGLVPLPLAGQNTLFLKGNGLWDKVFQFIREDEEGNIYIDGKATKIGSPVYLKDIFSNLQDLAENLRKIEIHDNVKFDKDSEFVGNVTVDSSLAVSGDVSVGGSSDFLGESRFSNNVIFNRNLANGSGPNKVTVNADLEVNGKSNFTDDMTATNITVDYLTVTKLAHFFELVIDKIRASQGQIIITDANATIDYVEKVDGVSRLYWRADSENQSNLSINEFVEGDLIVCLTFNRGQIQKNDDGSYQGFNVSNKYYWVVCSGVGHGVEKTFPDLDGNPGLKHVYNFVEISDDDEVSPKDGTFLPEIGDEIVQLGNRRDTLRQAAIIISAYNNAYLDKGIKAPAIVQYDGINDFLLETHRLNVISKGLNRFMGSYLTGDGKTDIVDKIGNVETTTNNKFSEILQTIDGITLTVSNNQTSIENINSSLGDLTIQVNTNTENISKIDLKADLILTEVTLNKNSITTINSSIGTLSGKVTENTTNISQLTLRADSIQAAVTQNSERIEEVSDSVSGDLTGIRNLVTTNTNNIAALTIKADNINSKVESNTTKIEKNGTDIGTANEKLESMQTTITNNKSEIDLRVDLISATVSSYTELIDDLTGKVTANTTNISKIDLKANSIESNVTSNTTTINNLSGSVTSLQSDMSDVKQTASSITSTVSSMKDEIIGGNCMLGLNGQGWSSNTIYEDTGNSFHCESTDWFQSHPIADFSGDYTFSFGVWGGDIQIKILEFRQTYYADGIYNQCVDFDTYTPCKILTTSSSVSNDALTNYTTSGTSSTWTYTNTETITLTVGDKVAVRVTNSTNNRYNSIYGTVSAINTSSKSVTVKAIKLLDQPNTICTLSCPTDKKDGTDINSLHYDEKLGRWWIRFKETSRATKTFVILFRNLSTSSIGYISRLMIEESVEYPHKYNSTGQASQSMIKQTALEIMMSVNDTYVKIGDGNITLNGDTQVNGSLTLNDEDQGFLLFGDGGTTEISPKSIGTYEEFKKKSTNVIKTVYSKDNIGIGFNPAPSWDTWLFTFNVGQDLGTLKKGSYLKFTKLNSEIYANNGDEKIGLGLGTGDVSIVFKVYENDVLKKTFNIEKYQFTYDDIGNYTVEGDNASVRIVGNFKVIAKDSLWQGVQPTISTITKWNNEIPTPSYMLIGYDGFAVNFGNNKTVYCGADGFIASYGVNLFRITSDGIWRNNHPNIKVLKGTDNSNSPATYTVQEPVDTVLCTGNYCKIIFPPNPYEGQTFRILDKALEQTYINSNGKKLVNHKTAEDGEVINLDYLGGKVFWTYVYIDGRWYESAET